MSSEIPQIPIDELVVLHADGIQLVDVREPDEYAEGHVPGAIPAPLSAWPDAAAAVPAEGTVYLICARGGRSQKAGEFLAAGGRDVVNVAGGTMEWIDAGHPVETGA